MNYTAILKALGAALISWGLNFVWMPKLIELLKKWHFGQTIREDGPKSHLKKQGTPVMGGLGFIASTLIAALIMTFKSFADPEFLIIIAAFVGYGAIGFLDDYLVVVRHNNEGLRPRPKFIMQCVLAVGLVIWYMAIEDTKIYTPFLSASHAVTYAPVLFFIIAAVMLAAETNAVNLSDGLDGLSSSLVAEALVPFVFFAYKENNESVMILLCAMIGGLIAYLHYNKYPAKVMMGDTGSLAMGGIFAGSALVLKQEWAVIIVGGVFLAEVLSVIIQVGYFKATHGKRFFRMAPLHHHFELGGMKEMDVVKNFRIAGGILALLGILMGVLL